VSTQNPIFNPTPGGLSDEDLLAYLEGRLTGDAARAVEEALAEGGAESDAVEGLQALGPEEAKRISARLNRELQRKMRSGKRVTRRGVQSQRWVWVAVAIVLLAAVLAYAVIHLVKTKQ